MSECNQDLIAAGSSYPRTCAFCVLGPCKKPYVQGAFGIYPRPKPPVSGSSIQRVPLSHAEEVDARAKALGLAIQILGPMTAEAQTDIAPDTLKGVANDFLRYLLEGK